MKNVHTFAIMCVAADVMQERENTKHTSLPKMRGIGGLTMRDRLIELINDCRAMDGYGMDLVEKQADHLLANGVTVQEWISVKDRLPKPTEKVLTYRRSLGDEYSKNTIEYMFLYNGEAVWTGDVDTWKTVVTHWMPLPQPPKGE